MLVLSRGDRARRVDKHAARTDGAAPAREDRALRRGELGDRRPASPASAGRRAPAASRAPSTADRRARGRTPPAPRAARRVGRPRRATLRARRRCGGARELARTAPVALDRQRPRRRRPSTRPGAWSCRRARRTGRARAPRRAARARARRASPRATARRNAPARHSGESCVSSGPSSTSASGSRGVGCAAASAPQLACQRRASLTSVFARNASSPGSLSRASSARASARAERAPTTGARSTPGGSA